MKIVNIKNVPKQQLGPFLFTGKVTRQSPVVDSEGSQLSVDYVHFPKGVRNKFHKHSNDQVLIVLEGEGVVASKEKQYQVQKGDVIWTAAGEVHWHGASKGSKFSHISITKAKTKLTQVEK